MHCVANRRVAMHHVREVLRLYKDVRLSGRSIAGSLGISRSAVSRIIGRFEEAGLSWPLPSQMEESQLEAVLYGKPQGRPMSRPEPDFPAVHEELRRKGVTLQLLWMEYKERDPDGYAYSQFCERYRRWRKTTDISMRQNHVPGDKCFVDYAGAPLRFVDPQTGEIQEACLFVAVLGASNYTYAEAHLTQDISSFVGGHVRAFAYFGGVPALLVPNNLKAGVHKADRYESELNRTYADMAAYYGTAVLPARPHKPKDKAKMEVGGQIAERWIIAARRHRTFFSLAELNQAIRALLERLNHRPFQKREGSRRSQFEQIDRPALRPLPDAPYELATWRRARMHIDCHIELERVYYSVPHAFVAKEVDVRTTEHVVEIFHQGRRLAGHPRERCPGARRTEVSHLPKAHQKHLEWNPERLVAWGRTVGPSTATLIERMLLDKPHPEMGYRACLGVLSLSKKYTPQRLERAAERALAIGSPRLHSVRSILQRGLDRLDGNEPMGRSGDTAHAHVRGAAYYQRSFLH